MSVLSSTVPAATPAKPAPRFAEGELANLDFLRAVAVGIVFVGHLLGTAKIRVVGDLGHFGVLLFFVHTALVLMMSMDRLRLSGSDLYKAFMIRRFFRIYPLSILTVIVFVCCRVPAASWQGAYVWAGWPAFASNILLTQNITQSTSINCVLWSLPFEIQMYAILPFLFLLAWRFPSPRAISAAWLAAAGIAALEYLARAGHCDLGFLLARYFPCFMAGVFAWRAMKVSHLRFPGSAWMLFLICLVVAYRLVGVVRVYGPGTFGALHGALRNDHRVWWPAYFDLVSDWLFCAAVGLAIPYFREIRNRGIKWLSKQIARYSYGIYVSHVPILWLCFVRFRIGPPAVSAVLAVFLTALVSVLAYHGLEDPAIRAGKRLAARSVQHPAFA